MADLPLRRRRRFLGIRILFVVSVASLGLVTLTSDALAERAVDRTAPGLESSGQHLAAHRRRVESGTARPGASLAIAADRGHERRLRRACHRRHPPARRRLGLGTPRRWTAARGFGLGAAVAGLGLVFVKRIPRAGRSAMAGVTTMGVALSALGTTSTFPVALGAMIVLGLASGLFGTVVHSIILTSTPKAQLGRVCGLVSLSIEGVVPLSFAATGVLAGLLGAHAPFLVGGLVILAATAIAFSRSSLGSSSSPGGATKPSEPGRTRGLQTRLEVS